MKFFYIYLLLAANSVTIAVAYYRKCYEEFSVCLISNIDDTSPESKFRPNWPSAVKWCTEKSSSLAIITNATVQSAIEAFINDPSAKLNSDIITHGYRFQPNYWEWINRGRAAVNYTHSEHSYHRYGYLLVSAGKGVTLNASIPTTARNFICSSRTRYSSCPNGHHQFGNRCYKIHNSEATSWFEARNLCLRERYDLATFGDIYLSNISRLLSNGEYWIGLRSEMWFWIVGHMLVGIEYSNWDDNSPSATEGDCLCMTANTGKWKNCDCTQNHRYICIQDYASNSNASSEPRLSSTGDASDLQSTPSPIMDNYSTDYASNSKTSSEPRLSSTGDASHLQSTSSQIMDNNSPVNIENSVTNQSPSYIESQRLIIWVPLAILIILIIVVALVGAWIVIKKRRNRNILDGESSKNETNQSPSSVDVYATLTAETFTANRTYAQLQLYETIGDNEADNKKPMLYGGSSKNKTNQSASSVDVYATLMPETSTENRTYAQLQLYETIRYEKE